MTDRDLAQLEAEARYSRERLGLYRARSYGGGGTTPKRLRELEQAADHAEQRLRAAGQKTTAK